MSNCDAGDTLMENRPVLPIVGVLLILATAAPASAQVLEEILVTAQKREQSMQDVGIAITAISGEQMEALGYTNAQQVTAMAPGVSTVQPNGEANYAIAIRGVANSDFTTNVESPVALYLDEVYISQMSGAGFMLFDMERVEILKGPQGTLYGRNATGGLAHYLTRKPTQEFEGYGRLIIGDYEQIKFDGAIGGGFGDKVSARLSVAHHQNDGYVTNVFPGAPSGKLNNADDQAWRLQLLFEPTDALSILLNYRGSTQDIRTGFFEHVTTTAGGDLQPATFNPVLGYDEVDDNTDPYRGSFDRAGFNELDTEGFSATVNWDINESMTLTSISDYSTVERVYMEDSDASPARVFNFFLTTDSEQLSQELRLSGETDRTRWVVGAYYLDLDISDSNGIVTDAFIEADPADGGFGIPTPFDAGVYNPYRSELESTSVFAQLEFDFSDQFRGIIGARYINDQRDYLFNAFVADFPAFEEKDYLAGLVEIVNITDLFGVGTAYVGERDDSDAAYRAQLDFIPNEDSLYYASFNRGVKSGGFNAVIFPFTDPTLNYDDETLSYDPEKLDAIEIGFKKTFADGRIRFNGAAYYYDYKDYQAFEIIGVDTLTRNADAESIGFELDLQGSPTDSFDFILGVAYNDIDVTLADGTKTTSVQSPEWMYNALARYEWQLGSGSIALQGDVSYRDEHYFSLAGIEAVREDGYGIGNVFLTYASEDRDWEISAFVKNVTDEEYLVQTFELGLFLGMTEQYFGRPRWWGISGRFAWGE